MEVKIGITDAPREVTVNVTDSADDLIAALKSAAQDDNGLFEVTDGKGRRVVVPAARVAYLDLGAPDARPVGFGAV